jgi:hypothetical protein
MTRLIVFYALVTILLTAAIIQQHSLASPQQPEPKPGTLLIITFENGTSKALRVDSTNILPVTGGYLIVDPTVVPGQPLPLITTSNKVVNQINTAIAIAITIVQQPARNDTLPGRNDTVPGPPPPPPPPGNNDILPGPICPEGEQLLDQQCVPITPGRGVGFTCPDGSIGASPADCAPVAEPEPTPEPKPEPEPDGDNNQDGSDNSGEEEQTN